MITKVTEYLTGLLLKDEVISNDDLEIYQYGMAELFNLVAVVSIVALIGLLFNEFAECLLFCVCFMTLRKYAGGYHSKTRRRCFVLTLASVVFVLTMFKFVEVSWYVLLGFMGLEVIVILLLSPVDTENNRLDNIEKKYCKLKTSITIVVQLMLFAIVTIKGFYHLSESIWGAWGILSISLVVESFISRKNQTVK